MKVTEKDIINNILKNLLYLAIDILNMIQIGELIKKVIYNIMIACVVGEIQVGLVFIMILKDLQKEMT
jgi:hypothetical protein